MGGIIEQRDQAVEILRRALQTAIRESGTTQREVEARNGYKPGYLSQVLKGHIALTLRHVMGVLLALDKDPASFFLKVLGSDEIGEIREQMTRYDAGMDRLDRLDAKIDAVLKIAMQQQPADEIDSGQAPGKNPVPEDE